LVNAIRSVKQGDFATRIKITSDNNEISLLSKGFNEMVTAIDQYRKDLVVVQKSLAWSDVARRVAHEIKNPLTPMQLAAERLRSKFSSQICYDKDNYDRYINIITRHIDDISKIIFNFINFVQMPKPTYIKCNFLQLIKELVDSRKALHEDVEYILSSNISDIDLEFDRNQINQVFVNLFQNAEESLKNTENKQILISITKEALKLIITINDNGTGLPKNMLNRPIEPYFTTKSTGTGLGLSIVDRIINDHNGVVELSNNSTGGASICLKFNLKK
jgi:two-component system nitrogen regulation sensor histidine kinase NtrY